MTPSCLLAFVVGRVVQHFGHQKWIALVKASLVPVALGLMLASGAAMMRAACHDWLTVAIAAATAAFVLKSRRNPLGPPVPGHRPAWPLHA